MSRKGSHPSRGILPDPKYGSVVIARFVNMIMRHGKKAVSESILYGAIDEIKNNSLIMSLFALDVSINGEMAISFGVRVDAVPATYTP